MYRRKSESSFWQRYDTKERIKEAWLGFKTQPYPRKQKKKKKIRFGDRFGRQFYICKNFKKVFFNKNKEDIIFRLRQLSRKVFQNTIPYEERRKRKHWVKRGTLCFCCKNTAVVQHHIILVKNGGYDNGINRIFICEECHNLIHDWLVISQLEREEQSDMESSYERY
jgi:5-methylcytosine-specific restriction endonuclease McrA